MSIESITQAVSNVALQFGDDSKKREMVITFSLLSPPSSPPFIHSFFSLPILFSLPSRAVHLAQRYYWVVLMKMVLSCESFDCSCSNLE